MHGFPVPDSLDKTIHVRARLGIVASLAARGQMQFCELKETLEMTDGNLSVHARVLENAGYLKVEKRFVSRKPCTSMSLTRKGRDAFRKYLEQLERIMSFGKK